MAAVGDRLLERRAGWSSASCRAGTPGWNTIRSAVAFERQSAGSAVPCCGRPARCRLRRSPPTARRGRRPGRPCAAEPCVCERARATRLRPGAACAGPCRHSRTSPRRTTSPGCSAGRRGRAARPRSSSCGPSTGLITASAIFGQALSMIAAPGSSILPLSSRSSRLEPAARQCSSRSSICWSRGFGAAVRRAPPMILRITFAVAQVLRRGAVHRRDRPTPSVCVCWRSIASFEQLARGRSSRRTSCRPPPASRRRLVVPVRDHAVAAASIPCGCSFCDMNPRHSYLPVPFVGRPMSTCGWRIGSGRSRTSRCCPCPRRTS